MNKNKNYNFLEKFEEQPFSFLSSIDFNKPFFRLSYDDYLTHKFVDLKDKYELNVTLPIIGDSLTVSVENNMVSISYSEKNDKSTYEGTYQFSLPEDANPDTIEAEVGVVNENTLTIRVKKIEEPKISTRKINVVHQK